MLFIKQYCQYLFTKGENVMDNYYLETPASGRLSATGRLMWCILHFLLSLLHVLQLLITPGTAPSSWRAVNIYPANRVTGIRLRMICRTFRFHNL